MKYMVLAALGTILLSLALTGCTTMSLNSDTPSTSVSQTTASVYDSLSQEEQRILDEYAITFAETFCFSFPSTAELDKELIGHFSFWQIYDEIGETNADGVCPISKEKLQTYVQAHFGIIEYDYPGDLPAYDPETKAYLFYPIGEGSLITPSIVEVKQGHDHTVCYTMQIVKSSMSPNENSEMIESMMCTYTFQLLKIQGDYLLQVISSQ